MASRVEYTDIPFLVPFICSCHVLKRGGAVAVLSRILIKDISIIIDDRLIGSNT